MKDTSTEKFIFAVIEYLGLVKIEDIVAILHGMLDKIYKKKFSGFL